MIDQIDVEPLLGFLHHDVLGGFDELGQVLQRLPQRGSSEREGLIVLHIYVGESH